MTAFVAFLAAGVGLLVGLGTIVHSIWKAVEYLERITSTLGDHEKRLERLEGGQARATP